MSPSEGLLELGAALRNITCRVRGACVSFDEAVEAVVEGLASMRQRQGVCWLLGNGGSGTIADHIACDLVLAGYRAFAVTNTALCTTMANDFGFERMFSGTIERCGGEGDLVVGMSCSGNSLNVLMAMALAPRKAFRVTLSGFGSDNMLNNEERFRADVKFWVPSNNYGVVQIAHLAVLHAIADLARDDLGAR